MRFHTALATVVLVLGVAAVVRATREQTEAAEAAEAAVEVDVQPQATVLLELSSLSAVYGAADRPRPKPGSAALNMAKYVDTNIKSSNQEEWGCCRVCDDLNDLVQKIPPALEPEYGHTVRDRRRHVAPERGFQEFAPPMVSCCPTCLWPPKLDPAAERTPTLQGDMETQMSTYGRGDGPRDAAVIAGAAASERVKEFAKFDAPNYRAPTEAMVTGMREREVKRRAARHAAEALLHARKYLNAEAIADAEAAVEANPMFLQVLAEVVADAEAEASAHGAYVDADADAEDAQAEADADAEGGAVADVDAEDADVEADAADLRMAQQHAVADAEAMSAADMEKFKLGKALKKVGKAAGKLVRKGLKGAIKLGKQLLKKFGKGLSKGLKDGAKEALGGAASAADAAAGAGAAANEQAAEEQSSDATEEGGERHRDGEEGAEEGADGEDGAGADAGAPAPPGGASLLPPSGLSPEERMEWVNARAERMEREAAERAAAHEQALRSGVPNVRSTAAAMQPHAAPVKPWNPLKDYRGDPMYYSLVTHPDVAYDDLGAGPKRAEELLAKRKPTPYLPPCCNMCGVNNGPRLTQPDRLSTCCYYCVRKPYGARPPRMRLRTSTRPEPKPKVTPETMARDLAAANARPQDDHADIFSPKPPMVHANRHRFG